MTPIVDEGGDLMEVRLGAVIKSSVPSARTKIVACSTKPSRGTLCYNDLAPDDSRQMTIDETGKEND